MTYLAWLFTIVAVFTAYAGLGAQTVTPRASGGRPPLSLADDPYDKTLRDFDLHPPTSAKLDAARQLYRKGVEELQQRDYPSARSAFEESIRMAPSYATIFNLGLCNQLLGNNAEAKKRYEEAWSIRPGDPELRSNLGVVLGRLGDRVAALQSFREGLRLLRSLRAGPKAEGQLLFQLGLASAAMEEMGAADWELQEAEEAFGAAGDSLGQAVVEARRGNILVALGDSRLGETLLLSSIARLNKMGADAEEATVRTDLAGQYLRFERLDEASNQLTAGVATAERSGNPLVLARALNDLGIYHLARKEYPEALKVLERALDKFRQTGDPVGQGQAEDNLGVLYETTGEPNQARPHFERALSHHEAAGLRASVVIKMLSIAAVADQQGDFESEASYLKDAQEIADHLQDLSVKARIHLAKAGFLRNRDPGRARTEAEAARTLAEAGDFSVLIQAADTQLAEIRADEIQRWLYRIAILTGVGWISLEMYRARGRLRGLARASGPALARIWTKIASPTQAILDRYDRWRDQWAPSDLPTTAEASAIVRAQRGDSRKTLGVFLTLCLIGALASDLYLVTYRNLQSIREVKGTVARWPFPTDVRTQLQHLLNREALYIVGHLVIQALLLTALVYLIWIALALFGDFLAGVLRRIRGGQYSPQLRSALAGLAQNNVEENRRLARLAPLLFLFVGAGLCLPVDWPVARVEGTTLILLTALGNIWIFRRRVHLIRSLSQVGPREVFDWLHRAGLGRWLSAGARMVGLCYGLLPLAYLAAWWVQKAVMQAPFQAASRQFSELTFGAGLKYHMVVFEGNTALLFTRLERSYEPMAGVGAVWDVIIPFLPYVFVCWMFLLFFWVLFPWCLSLEARVWQRLLAAFLLYELAVLAFEWVEKDVFHFDFEAGWVAAVGVIFLFGFMFYSKNRLHIELVEVRECPACKHRNAIEAYYCSHCGRALGPSR